MICCIRGNETHTCYSFAWLTFVWQRPLRAETGVTLPSMDAFMLATVRLGNCVAISAAAPAKPLSGLTILLPLKLQCLTSVRLGHYVAKNAAATTQCPRIACKIAVANSQNSCLAK